MTKQKLKITPSLNGYEVSIKDMTGFGPEGYSAEGLNVNNVVAVVLVLKDSNSDVVNRLRLEGTDKNEFMAGLKEVTISYPETDFGFRELQIGQYNVESYLITDEVDVRGLANQSEITGNGLEDAMKDFFVIDEIYEYTVLPGYTNGGTVLQLGGLIKRFFSKGSFGYKFDNYFVHYVKTIKVLYQLSSMRYGRLQQDGEFENYAVLTGHVNVIKWKEQEGDLSSLLFTIKDARVLTDRLNLRYFKL